VRLVSADIEGAEVALLRGARLVLEAHRPAPVLEASQPHLRRAGLQGVEDLHRELVGLHYRPFEIGRLDLNVVDPRTADAKYSRNWLCLPDDRADLLGPARSSLRRCGLMPCILRMNPMTRVAA
jgi:hypothetical protein